MTDEAEKPEKRTYKNLNPRVVLTTEGVVLSKRLKMSLMNDDGSIPDRKEYTNAELGEIVQAMLQTLPEDFEMGNLIEILGMMSQLAERAALSTLAQMAHLVHDEEHVGHLDHDLMCNAVNSYFNEDELEPEFVSQEQSEAASMLDDLLAQGRKPN